MTAELVLHGLATFSGSSGAVPDAAAFGVACMGADAIFGEDISNTGKPAESRVQFWHYLK